MTHHISFRPFRRPRFLLVLALVAAGVAAYAWSSAIVPETHAAVVPPPAQPAGVVTMPVALADLIQSVRPAVVNISVSVSIPLTGREVPIPPGPFDDFFRHFFTPQGSQSAPPIERGEATGSGFIIDPAGYIVTNHHVIDHADEITVTFQDGTQTDAKLLGSDPKTDLALLKIKADHDLPYVKFGDSDHTRVGDWVVAIGNPFGLGGTATTGIVSARGRDIQSGPYDDFLQIDAPINRGNSGGPLFDLSGKVIGINSAIVSPNGGNVGIGFAIPSDQAQPVLDQLRKSGHVERAWLGVQIQGLDNEMAEGLGLDKGKGAIVVSVVPDSPAEKAGLKAGDVIVGFNGEEVSEAHGLPRLVADAPVGKKSDIEVWRDGRSTELHATLEQQAEDDEVVQASNRTDHEATGKLGLALASLTRDARLRYQVPDDVNGALVVGVDPSGPAAERGVQPGDIIVMVGQTPVDGPDQAVHEIEKAGKDGRKAVVLELARGDNLRFVPLALA